MRKFFTPPLMLALIISLTAGLHQTTHADNDLPATEDGALLDRIVAVVGEDAIMQTELAERLTVIQRQLAERTSRMPARDMLQRQVLERMIIEHLQLQMAAERGIKVDDNTLNRSMRTLAKRNNLDLEGFRNALIAQGMDYVNFREQIRNELIITRLRQRVVDSRIQITDQEIDDLIATQGDALTQESEYHLAHILITVPEAATPEQLRIAQQKAENIRERALSGEDFTQLAISESDGQKALEGGDLGWRTTGQLPSLFADFVPRMETGSISELVRSASGFHIVKLVEQRGNDQAMIDQTHVRHILITPNALLSDEQARARLVDLKQRVEAGEDFASLAKANSDDKASAAEGGDLGWSNPGSFVPQFEEVMNSLEPGQLSEPFRSPFGWHVMQVLERRQHDSTEEFLRNRARNVLQQRRSEEETELWLRRLRAEGYVEYLLEPNTSGSDT